VPVDFFLNSGAGLAYEIDVVARREIVAALQ
jgi:hypothetical protein